MLPPVESTAMNKVGQSGTGTRGRGRPKGSKNKATLALKEAILMAADTAHRDGLVAYLRAQALESPSAFLTLIGKVLPTTVAGDKDNPVAHTHKVQIELVRP
jgi:hypothetical protein